MRTHESTGSIFFLAHESRRTSGSTTLKNKTVVPVRFLCYGSAATTCRPHQQESVRLWASQQAKCSSVRPSTTTLTPQTAYAPGIESYLVHMVPEAVNHIEEAGVRRRWHPRDVSSHRYGGCEKRKAAPNVHNSLAIQKKHVANMYRLARGNNETHPRVESG